MQRKPPTEAPSDTGRRNLLDPHEDWDASRLCGSVLDKHPRLGMARIKIIEPFWKNEDEQDHYEHTARTHPRRPGEGAGTYIARLASITSGRLAPATKAMPRTRQTRGQQDERLGELRKQAALVLEETT